MKATNKYDEYKKKKAAEIKKRREKQKEQESKLTTTERHELAEKRRNTVRKHVANYRQRKKNAEIAEKNSIDSETSSSAASKIIAKSYNSTQTLGKAVKKATKAFPTSPTRKQAVLAKIVTDLDDDARNELINIIASTPKRKSMTAPMIQDIHDFYERDDISRMSPKMRDVRKCISAETGLDMFVPYTGP